jgi:glycosyltransferase involved in cell wall biosynthesis
MRPVNSIRSVAAVGDVSDPHSWSGIPYHFWRAGRKVGFVEEPWRVDLTRFRWPRRFWNFKQLLKGNGPGGFQYSETFLRAAESQIADDLFRSEVISFSPHFPRAESIRDKGGQLSYYVDAPFIALASGRGLDLRLPKSVRQQAIAAERLNYATSDRVITMARWAADVITNECGVPASKVFTILPGANLELPVDWNFPRLKGRAGRDRDFVLGFVGKDWKRKGLPFLLDVRDELVRRGWRCAVRAVGVVPKSFRGRAGLEFGGFVDKERTPGKFAEFLASCDIGCLFSRRESLGISTLEFLHAGVPVAGFAHEGPADTLPPDAGFRFPVITKSQEVADVFESYLSEEMRQKEFQRNAQAWSPFLTWERCVTEMRELWETGAVENPIRLWLGLNAQKMRQLGW